MAKIVTAAEAVECIKDESTLVVNGFAAVCYPDSLAKALGERFLKDEKPRNIEFWSTISGSWGAGLFSERFGYEGLIKRAVISHWQSMVNFCTLAIEEKIEAYNLPLGVMSHLYRAAAGRKPGILTKVGLKTFVDPRIDGGRISQSAKEEIVRHMEIEGDEFLFYKAPRVDVCFIRGTTADCRHNITMEREPAFLDILSIAQATKANRGIVICQVERLSNSKSHPKEIKVPGPLIDYIVVAPDQMISRVELFNPAYTGEVTWSEEMIQKHAEGLAPLSAATKNPRGLSHSVIAKRAAMELEKNSLVNLGIGIPNMISSVVNSEGISDEITLTVETGAIGGVPAPAAAFGITVNPEVIYEQASVFDLYDSGVLDITFVGMAEVGQDGNVNVSKIGNTVVGVGGFINLTQNAKKTVFCGTFTSGKGLEIEFANERLQIIGNGGIIKFKSAVNQITFSGELAMKSGQEVLFITERAVFQLSSDGLVLLEIAPGIDLQKDILNQMEFKPVVRENVKIMDSRLFTEEKLGLKEKMNQS